MLQFCHSIGCLRFAEVAGCKGSVSSRSGGWIEGLKNTEWDRYFSYTYFRRYLGWRVSTLNFSELLCLQFVKTTVA